MGRWTPLILMAGGLAILLGTLLGISFPLGGQNNASVPQPEVTPSKASKVLPANINVNSTNSGNAPPSNNNKSSVAQSTPADDTNNTNNTDNNQNKNTKDSQTNDTNQSNEPVRALW